jgi:hypothetical protein
VQLTCPIESHIVYYFYGMKISLSRDRRYSDLAVTSTKSTSHADVAFPERGHIT